MNAISSGLESCPDTSLLLLAWDIVDICHAELRLNSSIRSPVSSVMYIFNPSGRKINPSAVPIFAFVGMLCTNVASPNASKYVVEFSTNKSKKILEIIIIFFISFIIILQVYVIFIKILILNISFFIRLKHNLLKQEKLN